MEAPQHVGLGGCRHAGGAGHGRRRLGHRAMIVSFEDLQELSGSRQPSKVAKWLEASRIPHVVGSDGKPRTTKDWLDRWLEDKHGKQSTEVRFTR